VLVWCGLPTVGAGVGAVVTANIAVDGVGLGMAAVVFAGHRATIGYAVTGNGAVLVDGDATAADRTTLGQAACLVRGPAVHFLCLVDHWTRRRQLGGWRRLSVMVRWMIPLRLLWVMLMSMLPFTM
jgi:hypothetical protein